jgi:hypothetical protein
MKHAFKWLCLVCFCIVLVAVPLGVLEVVLLQGPNATILGCHVGELASIYCGGGVLKAVADLVLNLPFGFVMAPLFLMHPAGILNDILVPPSMPSWMKYTHPLVIYLSALDLILILAIIHVLSAIVRFATGRWWRHA